MLDENNNRTVRNIVPDQQTSIQFECATRRVQVLVKQRYRIKRQVPDGSGVNIPLTVQVGLAGRLWLFVHWWGFEVTQPSLAFMGEGLTRESFLIASHPNLI